MNTNGNVTTLVNGARGRTSPYGRTKHFAETILVDVTHADPSMTITALRYSNSVGSHLSGIFREDPRQKSTFPCDCFHPEGSQNEVEIFGNNWSTRDGTTIRDITTSWTSLRVILLPLSLHH
jgi:UDP-glucose 4-epimerase